MKCPKCVELGERSTLHVSGGGFSTLVGFQPHYDEDGVSHSHNPNKTSSLGKCSNGHRLAISTRKKCPAEGCDYGGETVTVMEPRETAKVPK